MMLNFIRISSMACALLLAVPAWAQSEPATGVGPEIDLPPETEAPPEDVAPVTDPVRGLQEERFRRARKTSIGGYGELHYNLVDPEGAPATAQLDLHRFVVFIAHRFNDEIRFYSEVEIEHAFAADGAPGEVGIEQAYVEWDLAKRLALRAGVVLVPMGIVNQWHEPPVFNGVERPALAKSIIPTTWREGGVGIFGSLDDGLRYELYLISALDPMGFSAGSGLRGGRQHVAQARADGLALTGRLEWEPGLGTVLGGAFYAGTAGPNADLFDTVGNELDLLIPVVGGAVDARTRRGAVEARAVLTGFAVGDTAELRDAVDADANAGPDVGSVILGGYAELGYDLLWSLRKTQQLIGFARFERYDTMFRVKGRDRTASDDARGVSDYVVGLSYRPLSALVFKADFILRNPDGDGHARLFNLGVGYMF